ncbi:NAD-dependent epimerase/dehydratase family protein [Streptomyces sp. M10(2022)]
MAVDEPAPAPPLHCLVSGATGYIGGRLVPGLLAAGRRVRCLARSPNGCAITRGEARSKSPRVTSRTRPPSRTR